MSELGKELVELHLLKSVRLNKVIGKYPVKGNDKVDKVDYDDKKNRIYINPAQYFEGISKEIWEYYIGGYQVLDKWLKSRKERTLSKNEIDHFLNIAMAINQTIELQKKIDKIYFELEKAK